MERAEEGTGMKHGCWGELHLLFPNPPTHQVIEGQVVDLMSPGQATFLLSEQGADLHFVVISVI